MVHVIGLGPGDISGLPMGTYRLLQQGWPIILRTRIHPVVRDLEAMGIAFTSFDDLYETSDRFDEMYRQMAERVRVQARVHDHVVYAVPGHPLVAEASVQYLLACQEEDLDIEIGPGQSFLDIAAARLQIDPIEGLVLLDGTALSARQLQTTLHTLIAQVYQRSIATEVKLTLMEVYPDDFSITVLRAAGVAGDERIEQVPLYELDRIDWIDHLTTVYVPPLKERMQRLRDPWEAVEIVRILREPGGCPWDRKQTHESLRRYVIEEAYEVAEAIDEGDPAHLAEELGDLVLQVLLHAQIGSEFGDFDVRDVFETLSEKLLRRHPHVFGDVRVETSEDVARVWDAVKQAERANESRESIVSGVSLAGPAITVAQEVQKAVSKVGFDWKQIKDVLEKVKEEMTELENEILRERIRSESVSEELGDLIFACVNVGRFLQLDVEALLMQATRKFVTRFQFVEKRVAEEGYSWNSLSPEALDRLWNEAKIALADKI
ncbi:nucleoside triphosphate pyrophosphohydrolase [Alicyclobacillus acidiphilus]|uniref:nucleoside triphosphate pyrophosphohydrolase n=1 Tax=Alicyclobacillus acidiphilus TaxID=182455 RepID=UPI001FE0D188|nr:nucleoside triphosphate pyrophosphohydrolase [Alicyclobacillus acidiphilus]